MTLRVPNRARYIVHKSKRGRRGSSPLDAAPEGTLGTEQARVLPHQCLMRAKRFIRCEGFLC